MPATLEPPAVVSAPPGPSADEVAARAAQTTISVSALPQSGEPAKPPKPGSARAKLFGEMQKKFGGEASPPAQAAAPAAKSSEASPASPRISAEDQRAARSPEQAAPSEPAKPSEAASPTEAAAAATSEGKRVSPWKLVDQFKERASKAEARIMELEKQIVPEEQRKTAQAQYEQLQAKMKEMAEDLRYYQSEKYDPDVIKAKEAYTRSMNRAMAELKEVSVIDPATQQPRAITVEDIAELAFMPLGQAQQVAKSVFGDLAPYVMDHRNEIRRLWDAQEATKAELKKNGAAREQQRIEAMQKAASELTTFIEQTYEQAKAEAVADPKHGHFFKPKEGDAEWNTRLEKGFKLVDDAFAKNAADPALTREQRQDIIRHHAAIRNRAAAFGPLRYENETLRKQLNDALSELKQYKETTPAAGGRKSEAVTESPKGMKGLMAELQKIAH